MTVSSADYGGVMSDSRIVDYAGSLSFLLSQIGAESAHLFSQRLMPMGMSPRAFGVLSNLATAESQTQQELADALGIHRNNMVGLVDQLEASGWVRRHRSPSDRRAYNVRLTPAGVRVVRAAAQLVPPLDDIIAARLDRHERRELTLLLKKVADTLALRPGIHPHLGASSR